MTSIVVTMNALLLLAIGGSSTLRGGLGNGSSDYQERIASESARSQGSPESRIIGGESVAIEEYPFAVSLQNNGTFFGHDVEHFCGGGIIGEKWIITSAQCVLSIQVKAFHVRVGTSRYYEGGDIYDVRSVVIHPAFNAINYDYDVGLVELSSSIKFDNRKQPIKLPKPSAALLDGSLVRVIGWGAFELLGAVSNDLLQTTMWKISDESCQEVNQGDILTNRMFCTASDHGSLCVGDSGSPLVYQNSVFGIASWSRSCRETFPTTFTAIAEVRDWISKVTAVA